MATAFIWGCGATTGEVTKVSVRSADAPLRGRGDGIVSIRGEAEVILRWTSNQELAVSLPDVPVLHRIDRVGEVRVNYSYYPILNEQPDIRPPDPPAKHQPPR